MPLLFRLSTLLMLSPLLVGKSSAGDAFTLSTRTISIPESNEQKGVVLHHARAEITCLPPADWRTSVDTNAGVITWFSKNDTCLLRLTLTSHTTTQTPPIQSEELRRLVLQEVPDSNVLSEFPCYSAGLSGLAFDVEGAAKNGPPMRMRFAFIAFPGGWAQVKISTASDDFTKRQVDLSNFLNSLQIAAAAQSGQN